MSSDLVKKTAAYVKLKLAEQADSHDWYHVERVWRTAKILQSKEGGDLDIIELAALLHDLGDSKQNNFEKVKSPLILRGMMDVLDIEEDLQKKIIKIAEEVQYVGEETKPANSLEGKIVQDADWLDGVGAIGIARMFQTGGKVGRVIYDPKRKIKRAVSKEDVMDQRKSGSSFNYFFERTLKLPAMMNTKTAKTIAEGRAEFLEKYLEQFKKEWEGER